jgi:hypothetical protein
VAADQATNAVLGVQTMVCGGALWNARQTLHGFSSFGLILDSALILRHLALEKAHFLCLTV